MKTKKPILAWHCLKIDERIRRHPGWFGSRRPNAKYSGRKVRVGDVLTVKPPVTLCVHGLHASRKLKDAMSYSNNNLDVICRVALSGDVARRDDKLCASERRVLGMTQSYPVFADVVLKILRRRWKPYLRRKNVATLMKQIHESITKIGLISNYDDVDEDLDVPARISTFMAMYRHGLPENFIWSTRGGAKLLEDAMIRAMKRQGRWDGRTR